MAGWRAGLPHTSPTVSNCSLLTLTLLSNVRMLDDSNSLDEDPNASRSHSELLALRNLAGLRLLAGGWPKSPENLWCRGGGAPALFLKCGGQPVDLEDSVRVRDVIQLDGREGVHENPAGHQVRVVGHPLPPLLPSILLGRRRLWRWSW